MTETPKNKRVFMTDRQIANAYALLGTYLVRNGDYVFYTFGWSDERIAEEVSTDEHPLNVGHIRPRREKDFGLLKPPPTPGSAEAQVEALRELVMARDHQITLLSRQLDELDDAQSAFDERLSKLEAEARSREDLQKLIEKARKAFRETKAPSEEAK